MESAASLVRVRAARLACHDNPSDRAATLSAISNSLPHRVAATRLCPRRKKTHHGQSDSLSGPSTFDDILKGMGQEKTKSKKRFGF